MIRVELVDWQKAGELRQQIDNATTLEELKAALKALLDHLASIEYIGEPD